jgi:hypothetical protein
MKPMRTMVHCEEGPLVAPAIRTSTTFTPAHGDAM